MISLGADGAEYVEAPFQKYSVMFSQKTLRNLSSELFPMVMYGEKFLCGLPSEEEILSERNTINPDINVIAEKIDAMPCLIVKQSDWYYVICSHIIYQIHNRNFSRNIVGVRDTDDYKEKVLEGFWGKGRRIFYTRYFIGEKNCGGSKNIQTLVWYTCRQSNEEVVSSFLHFSPCRYEIHIFTPRVCSGIDFESETGRQIPCYAEKDALALVLANKDRSESPRYSLNYDFSDSPKSFGGDVFFVANANIGLNEEAEYKKASSLTSDKDHEKKCAYRADEIMSATMGLPFNFSAEPQNQLGDTELILNMVKFLQADIFYRRGLFSLMPLHEVVEKLKKMIHSSKKDKRKNIIIY